MLVREIMTSPAVTIDADADAAEAARVLDLRGLTSLPVVDHELRLLGIIGEADVIGKLWPSERPTVSSRPRVGAPRVRDVMTRCVFTVDADDDLGAVVPLMSGTTLKSLPVLLHERVVGMLSRRDVVRVIAHEELDAGVADRMPA